MEFDQALGRHGLGARVRVAAIGDRDVDLIADRDHLPGAFLTVARHLDDASIQPQRLRFDATRIVAQAPVRFGQRRACMGKRGAKETGALFVVEVQRLRFHGSVARS
ncbi:hypothetical protein QCE63_15110 [Caballeronia sp. LZ065]|uniref:hypothetical protein n=1 Tax=Caballeronia sp. LZ065 TaxID=3038571 RepID=UPI00286478A2|nr:hypothetical protein [Caballeronia sp. LZ065]MDR5780751.1 hypothetical protein [Caballeronia sp. LZ065]